MDKAGKSRAVRQKGIAFEDEECRVSVSGVAAEVKDSEGGTIGAIFIRGRCVRLTHEVLEKIAPSLQRCAARISEELGYQV